MEVEAYVNTYLSFRSHVVETATSSAEVVNCYMRKENKPFSYFFLVSWAFSVVLGAAMVVVHFHSGR